MSGSPQALERVFHRLSISTQSFPRVPPQHLLLVVSKDAFSTARTRRGPLLFGLLAASSAWGTPSTTRVSVHFLRGKAFRAHEKCPFAVHLSMFDHLGYVPYSSSDCTSLPQSTTRTTRTNQRESSRTLWGWETAWRVGGQYVLRVLVMFSRHHTIVIESASFFEHRPSSVPVYPQRVRTDNSTAPCNVREGFPCL